MDTRSLFNEEYMADDQGQWGRTVSREEMRQAAQTELEMTRQLLTTLREDAAGEPITALLRTAARSLNDGPLADRLRLMAEALDSFLEPDNQEPSR
jgi:hypothetical protein